MPRKVPTAARGSRRRDGAVCGITGIVARGGVGRCEWLESASAALRHRGPDADGTWRSADGRAAFAHRRLSIIDLGPSGDQPMLDAAGRASIVFNGEIYNYRELRAELLARGRGFRSGSDTEVILAAYGEWGTDCVSRLEGMFAFAIYDTDSGSLFMARDRAGEKPLYYRAQGDALSFASELKALMADPGEPRRIDPEALDCYLYMGFAPGERCILRGCRKLPPAHALLFDAVRGGLRVWRYWQPPEAAPVAPAGGSELVAELERLLAAAVRRQMVADVPLGVLLSGGVDSSLVTAMACRAGGRIRTYTARFPEDAALDETAHARLIAAHFGTEHTELAVERPTTKVLPLLARQFDEPIADSSMIPTYLICRAVRSHCKVALGGDGGDELFGGYRHYSRLLWMHERVSRIPHRWRSPVARAALAVLPLGFRGRNWVAAAAADLEAEVPLIACYFDCATRGRLLAGTPAHARTAEAIREQRLPETGDLLQRASRFDLENYLPEDILVKVDRASMLSSLEVRAPLLDRTMVEFACREVPSSLKATSGARKVLLKQLAARVLPPQFDRQRKQGFSIPLARWLNGGDWAEFFQDVLLGPQSTLLDHESVRGLLRGQERGRANGERLFALVMFELWRREYGASL
jgi:asparagine synthase (glutamine-hydrolysing)